MKKKSFGRFTAIGLAAITAIPTMAIVANADLTKNPGTILNPVRTVSGSAVLVDYGVSKQTITYTASYDATTNPANPTLSITAGNATPDLSLGTITATTELKYDDTNTVDVKKASAYFDLTSNANAFTSKITKACTYNNANGNSAGKGQTDYAVWETSWKAHQFNTKASAAWVAAGKKLPGWTNYAGENQTSAYSDDKSDTTFVKTIYTSEIKTESISATNLKAKFGDKISIGTDGLIAVADDAASDWTINTTGSSTGTTTSIIPPAAYQTPSTASYLGDNGVYYTSYYAAFYYGGGCASSTGYKNNYSTVLAANPNSTIYFNAANGQYYASVSGLTSGYYYAVTTGSTYYSSTYGSYRAADGRYYPTANAAQYASYTYNGTYAYTTKSTTASAQYLNTINGLFYSTASAAQAATPTYSSSYINLATYTSSSYDYLDPYYYYLNGGYGFGYGTKTKIDPADPTIYGSSKKSGWTRIASIIKTTKKGSTVKIDMNEATSVPSSVMAAAKTCGVNLKLVLNNGATWTIKASNITSTDTLNINVSYGLKTIKTSLVNKAKKVNSNVKSTAQMYIGDNGSLGLTADVTVKLSSKRAGCTVKAYRLTNSGTLSLADTAKVQSTGAVTFEIENGGAYLLVIKK